MSGGSDMHGSTAAPAGSSRVLNDACRAIEKLQQRLEEVERHNLSLNENVKNCAQLIKLTQAFAEEQGKESTGALAKLEEQITAAARGVQEQAEGAEKSLTRRVDQIQTQMAELVVRGLEIGSGCHAPLFVWQC